jgi:hypothetical protein
VLEEITKFTNQRKIKMTVKTEQELFEEFMKSSRPPWFCKFEKNEELAYKSGITAVFYLAWVLGVADVSIDTLLKSIGAEDAGVDVRDSRCFSDNKLQRLYWCYWSGKHSGTEATSAPCLLSLGFKLKEKV